MLERGVPVGGSNGLQMVQFFFCEIFMIFVHEKKSLNRKLEKTDFLEHPNGNRSQSVGIARPFIHLP